MVEGPDEVFKLAAWIREHGLRDLFVVGGDAEQPHGPYADGLTFLRDLLAHDHGLERIGVPAYPDGHPFIDRSVLARRAARQGGADHRGGRERRRLDADVLRRRSHPRAGSKRNVHTASTLPIHLGVPGVVDRTRLMTMGARLGVGTSLRYLSKNRATVMRMLAPGGYDPTDLVRAHRAGRRSARRRRPALVHVQQRRRHRQVARRRCWPISRDRTTRRRAS